MSEPSAKAISMLKDTYKKDDTVLLGAVERHLLRRPPGDRDMSQLHPSDMAKGNWCARQNFYQIQYPELNVPEEFSAQTQRIFEEGHAIHAKWQLWLQEMGLLWGKFRCQKCYNIVWELSADLEPCHECGALFWEYREVPLTLPSHAMIGHTDGVLILPDGKVSMLEIKSVGLGTVRVSRPKLYAEYSSGEINLDKLWWRIKRPFAAHLRQGMFYIAMAQAWNEVVGSQIMPKIDQMIFIYEWKPTQAVREFVIPYAPEHIDDQMVQARAVAHALAGGPEPSRPAWLDQRNENNPVCVKCPYRTRCWSLDDPETAAPTADERPAVRIRPASRSARNKALGK